MRSTWTLPDKEHSDNSGEDWLQNLLVLGQVNDITKSRILMLMCRSRHLRNDAIQQDGKETIEHISAFLESYDVACCQNQTSVIGKTPLFAAALTTPEKPSCTAGASWSARIENWVKLLPAGCRRLGGVGAVVLMGEGGVGRESAELDKDDGGSPAGVLGGVVLQERGK
jgi:hypothetical protein